MVSRVRMFAVGIGLLSAAVGLAVLTGWAAHVPLLVSIRPEWIPMAPLTAVAFVLAGISLACLSAGVPRWNQPLLQLSRACAGLVLLIGMLRIGEYLGLWALRMDFLWFDLSQWRSEPTPAVMATGTALGLSLIGLALLIESRRIYIPAVQILLLLQTSVAWLSMGPYFYGGDPLLPISGMASHTGACLFLLGVGLLCARPDGGLVSLTLCDTSGGTLARWLLPPVLLLPFAFEYFQHYGETAGWYGSEAGQSLLTLLTSLAFGLLIWGLSVRLRSTELGKRSSDLERARLNEIVEYSDDAIIGTSLDGNVTAWNSGAERMFGYSRGEIVGQSARLIVPDAKSEKERDVLARIGRGEHVELRETTRLRKDGTTFPAWVKLAPLLGSKAEVIGVSEITRDLTEVHKAEAEQQKLRVQFEQSQKMESVGRLAGGIAHDFNNLLTVINGYTEIAMSGLPKEHADLRGDLEQVLAAGLRAAGLTRQLLAFSRRQVLQPEVLNVNRVVQDLDKMLRRLIGEDIEISLRLAEDLGKVMADPGQIEQVLMNLVVNARDAMPKGGKLSIETANVELDADYAERHLNVAPGAYVMVAVTDTGVGMDSSTMARIFEPFFTTKDFGKGTGLGLATVYGIVRQSGGNVWAYSEVGRGSVFKVYLPQTGAAPRKAQSAEPESTRGSGETILIVEDDDRLRALTMRILAQNGYTTHGIGSGSQAVAFIRDHAGPMDLVITDVVMPGMSGMELAQRTHATRSDVRFVFMSGYTDDTIVRHGGLDQRLEFISKPFTTASLLTAVRKALDREAVPV